MLSISLNCVISIYLLFLLYLSIILSPFCHMYISIMLMRLNHVVSIVLYVLCSLYFYIEISVPHHIYCIVSIYLSCCIYYSPSCCQYFVVSISLSIVYIELSVSCCLYFVVSLSLYSVACMEWTIYLYCVVCKAFYCDHGKTSPVDTCD